jgi:apolipoprotein N-acyltransferase
MDRPEVLVLYDGAYFTRARGDALGGLIFMAFVIGIVLAMSDATLGDLALPIASLGVFWFVWVAFHGLIAWHHRSSDRRAIVRLFEGEIWAHWKFHAPEWQGIVDAEYQSSCPEKGLGAYVGAVYSSIFGLVIATILVAVGKFFIKEPEIMPVIWISALAVFLLFLGVGLFQPIQNRQKAQRHRRKAQRVSKPRIWFSSDGVYHETLGYTSLKELEKVTDQTRTRNAITFTISVTTVFGGSDHSSSSTHSQRVSFSVPSGFEQQAAQLVRRYRQERLRQ